MASAAKALLGGIILGIIIVIAVETLVAVAFLSSQGVKNPFGFAGAVLSHVQELSKLNLSAIKSINITGIKSLANITKIAQSNATKSQAYVNVSNVSISGVLKVNTTQQNASVLGELTYEKSEKGFSRQAGSVANYTITIPDYTKFDMQINNISSGTQNFEVLYIIPKLPQTILPGSSSNFTLIVKLPDSAYAGRLRINFSASA